MINEYKYMALNLRGEYRVETVQRDLGHRAHVVNHPPRLFRSKEISVTSCNNRPHFFPLKFGIASWQQEQTCSDAKFTSSL